MKTESRGVSLCFFLFYSAKMRKYSDNLQKKMTKIKNMQKNQYMLTMDKTKP